MSLSEKLAFSYYAKIPIQKFSVFKKEISRLKAELICKIEQNDRMNAQVANLQKELKNEKKERQLLQENYTKLRQKSVQLNKDFEEVCEKLRSHLEECQVQHSPDSLPFNSMMALQVKLDDLRASFEDKSGADVFCSAIRKDIYKTFKQLEEIVELIDSIDDNTNASVSQNTGTAEASFESEVEEMITCGICNNSFSNQAIFSNHQKICRREGPSTSRQSTASFHGNDVRSTPNTRPSAKKNADDCMGPPSLPINSSSSYGKTNFCGLAKRLATSSSTTREVFIVPKLDAEREASVIALTVVNPIKVALARKHRRDVTKRHDGFFCNCGIRFVKRNGLDQHREFHTKCGKKMKKPSVSPTVKNEKED